MNSRYKKFFDEAELKDFKTAIAHDNIIIPTLLKILDIREQDHSHVSMDDANWVIKRAAYDGQSKEIQWWVNFLKEGQGGQEEKED